MYGWVDAVDGDHVSRGGDPGHGDHRVSQGAQLTTHLIHRQHQTRPLLGPVLQAAVKLDGGEGAVIRTCTSPISGKSGDVFGK